MKVRHYLYTVGKKKHDSPYPISKFSIQFSRSGEVIKSINYIYDESLLTIRDKKLITGIGARRRGLHCDYLPDWLVNPFSLQYGQQSPSRQSQACHFSFFCNNEHVKTWVRHGSHTIAQCWEVEPRAPGQRYQCLGGLGASWPGDSTD